jgi:hypothetical protein
MTFEGSYPRLVRIFPTSWRIFIRRAGCAACGKGHALLPDFVALGRLDHVEVIGAALVAGVAPSPGERTTPVRGHEKVSTGGQMQVPTGGHVEVPTSR